MKWTLLIKRGLVTECNQGVFFLFCYWQHLFSIKILADFNCAYLLHSFILCITCSPAGCLQCKRNTYPHELIQVQGLGQCCATRRMCCVDYWCQSESLFAVENMNVSSYLQHRRKQEIPQWHSLLSVYSLTISNFCFGCCVHLLLCVVFFPKWGTKYKSSKTQPVTCTLSN